MTLDGLTVTRDSRVLDIGAGPGTLAIPLAPRVKEVTAVEPGAGMVSILQERAAREGITNIRCIQKRWEDVDPALDLDRRPVRCRDRLPFADHGGYPGRPRKDECRSKRGRSAFTGLRTCHSGSGCTQTSGSRFTGSRIIPARKPTASSMSCTRWGFYPDVEMMPLAKEYRFSSREEMERFFNQRFDAHIRGAAGDRERVPHTADPGGRTRDRDLRELHVRKDLVEEKGKKLIVNVR